MYGDSLAALAGSLGGGVPAAPGVGAGKPPMMGGLPPPPTMTGAMPTGDPSTTKKAAADQAILALREASGHYPQLKSVLDATVDALKAAAGPGGPAGATPGSPSPPGAPPPVVPSPPASGSPGDF